MSAFGDGIEIMSVFHRKSSEVLSGSVAYRLDGNKRLYRWNTAEVTSVQPATVVDGKISPAKLLYPSRMASLAEMAQMARFADFSRRDGNAVTQLKAYIYAGVYLLNKVDVMTVAA